MTTEAKFDIEKSSIKYADWNLYYFYYVIREIYFIKIFYKL